MFNHINIRYITGKKFNNFNHPSIVKSIATYREWNPFDSDISAGAIFNFDFKNDGSILAAACENNCFLLFDAHNGQLITHQQNAHEDSVNCIKFIDSRLFATCSDDTTIALWDARKTTERLAHFRGHSNWVKNIEYLPTDNCLLSSGFDANIYMWDLNECEKYTTSVLYTNKILHLEGLFRTQISKDGTKIIISTFDGYILIIHDIDFQQMDIDLSLFNGTEYRRAQLARSMKSLRAHAYSNKLKNSAFLKNRNRIELIYDFPEGFEHKNIISSLKIHPHDWCVLSRCTADSKDKEWTCIHDIQGTKNEVKFFPECFRRLKSTNLEETGDASDNEGVSIQPQSADLLYRPKRIASNDNTNNEQLVRPSKKLLFYAGESIEQRLYIKEPCFSPDGRIIISPFGSGFRILAFDKDIPDLSDAMEGLSTSNSSTRELKEINWTRGTNIYVLTVAHCPVSPLIVSGGVGGCVSFHRPIL